MFQVTLEAEDRLALFTGLGSNDVLLPRRTIERDDFPDAPDDVIGRPVPIVYGDFTRNLVASQPPALVENLTHGLIKTANLNPSDGGRGGIPTFAPWNGGWGDVPTPDPPSGVTLSIRSGGEIQRSATVWTPRLYVIAATINASGVYSHSYPYWNPSKALADAVGVTSCYIDYTADNVKLQVDFTWASGATTGWKTAVYCGHNFFGVRYEQVIEVNFPDTRATFDRFDSNGANAPASLSTGASFCSDSGWYLYGVAAITAGGETGLSDKSTLGPGVYRRPNYLEWTAVPGATGYRIYRLDNTTWTVPTVYWDTGNVTNYTWYVDTGTSVDTSLRRTGPVPLIPVGTRTASDDSIWSAFLLCGHAITAIGSIYQDGGVIDPARYGNDICVPGRTGFSSRWGTTTYVDLNGHRYTLVYARGTIADDAILNGKPLSCAPQGIEDSATGNGALITNIYDQYLHFIKNWVLNSYMTGSWTTVSPTWGDTPYDVPIVDDSSFYMARDATTARVSGGYPGAFCVGADRQETVRTWLARLNQSADCYCGFSRKSQLVVRVLDDTLTLTSLPRYTAQLGILAGSFSIRDDSTAIENKIEYTYEHNYTDASWEATGVEEDTTLQTAMAEIKPYALNLYACRTATAAADIAARRLLRRKYPYRTVAWTSDMGALTVDLGDLVRVTHPDGLGEDGWTDRPVFILRHEFDPQNFTIRLEALDVAYAFDNETVGSVGAVTFAGLAPTLSVV